MIKISLKNRLVLTYSLFTCASILLLGFVVNYLISDLFSGFVKDNIRSQSTVIAQLITDEYIQSPNNLDTDKMMAIGMTFLQQGYIVSVTDTDDNMLWSARECDMTQCAMVTVNITSRMSAHQAKGEFQSRSYPLVVDGKNTGKIIIESYGPFFYNENESAFIDSVNRYLLAIGAVFTLLSIVISILLANTISKPVLKASRAAKEIAEGDLTVRIPTTSSTKELQNLSLAINELAVALENGEKWQKRLTSDIAHELRTPLATLQGYIEAIQDGIWAPTPERIEICHEEVVRLSKLTEDLNLLSILEQKNAHIYKSQFNLSKLVSTVVEQFQPLVIKKNIPLKFITGEYPINADYDKIKQVLVNLLSNAFKYTDSGEISIDIIDISNEYSIKITDSGIGIPQESIPHVFERFYRADKSRTRVTGGTGIGLAITSAIIAAHGGKIVVESEYGKGSTFTVTLPK